MWLRICSSRASKSNDARSLGVSSPDCSPAVDSFERIRDSADEVDRGPGELDARRARFGVDGPAWWDSLSESPMARLGIACDGWWKELALSTLWHSVAFKLKSKTTTQNRNQNMWPRYRSHFPQSHKITLIKFVQLLLYAAPCRASTWLGAVLIIPKKERWWDVGEMDEFCHLINLFNNITRKFKIPNIIDKEKRSPALTTTWAFGIEIGAECNSKDSYIQWGV